MEEKKIWVVGHKNPDTDSICAAIAYADFKNRLEKKEPHDRKVRYIPKRAGEVSAETRFVLNYFHKKAPSLVTNAGTQIKDITIRRTEGISSHISMKKAWEMMKILKVVTLPIVNAKGKLEGVIVTGDVATSYMDVYDNAILSSARTQYRNIVETLGGKAVTGNIHGYFVKGKVVIGAGTRNVMESKVESDDLVIIGDNEDYQLQAIEANCSCLVITNSFEVSKKVINNAEQREVVVISTPYDTFTTARLINQSIPVKYFMTTKGIIHFSMDDYVDDVREVVSKIRHRDFPVLDENRNYMGMFSRRNLLSPSKKQIILVDHNERSQALDNIDEAEVLEIIDHHRLGSLETMAPVYFRNQPLGCTATIIYQMYREKEIEVTPEIAGLLCSAIISDTLMFRSPTCTAVDKEAALTLAELAGIEVEEFAMKMFEAGSNFGKKTDEEILNSDFKIFHAGEIAFGVTQVSGMSRVELDKVKERLQPKLSEMMGQKSLDLFFVMLTDILMESTVLIYEGKDAGSIVSDAFRIPGAKEGVLLKGVVSRKKQLIPSIIRALSER